MEAVNWEFQTAAEKYVHKAPKIQSTYSYSVKYTKEIFYSQQTEIKYFVSRSGKKNIILFQMSTWNILPFLKQIQNYQVIKCTNFPLRGTKTKVDTL